MNELKSVFEEFLFLSRYTADIHKTPETGNGFLNFSFDFIFNSSSKAIFLFLIWTVFFSAVILILAAIKINHFKNYDFNLTKKKILYKCASWFFFDKTSRLALSLYSSYLFMFFSKTNGILTDITNISFYLGIVFLIITFLPGVYSDKIRSTGLSIHLKKEYYFSLLSVCLLFLSVGIFKITSPQNMYAMIFLSVVFFFVSLTAINIFMSLFVFTLFWSNWHEYILLSLLRKEKNADDVKIVHSFFKEAIENGKVEKLKYLSIAFFAEKEPIFIYLCSLDTEQFIEKTVWLITEYPYRRDLNAACIENSIFKSFEYRNTLARSKSKIEKEIIYKAMYGFFGRTAVCKENNMLFERFMFRICERFLKIEFLDELHLTGEDPLEDFLKFARNKDRCGLLAENFKKTTSRDEYVNSVLLTFFNETYCESGFVNSIEKEDMLKLISYVDYFMHDFFRRNGISGRGNEWKKATHILNSRIKTSLQNTLNMFLKKQQDREFIKSAVAASILSDVKLDKEFYYIYDRIDNSAWSELLERNSRIKGKLFCDMFDYIHEGKNSNMDTKQEIYILLLSRSEFCTVFLREGYVYFDRISKQEFDELASLYKKNLDLYESMNIFLNGSMFESEGSRMEIEKIMKKMSVNQTRRI